MHRSIPFKKTALLLAVMAGMSCSLHAAPAATTARVVQAVDNAALKRLAYSTHPLAKATSDRGRVDASMPMRRMILVLRRSDAQEAALANALSTRKGDARPVHDMTPEQFSANYGLHPDDLKQVTGWLALQGLHIDSVARGGQWIEFSGNVGQVENAFHTQIHHYEVDSAMHTANASDITIPQALASVVAGVLSLNDFGSRPMHSKAKTYTRDASQAHLGPAPNYNDGDAHYLTPGDFAKIYRTTPLIENQNDGTGIDIAIPGRTAINLDDVRTFRNVFGLPANDPVIVSNGTPPLVYPDDELESDLDVQWAGAAAPGATIHFVTTDSTFSTDGIDLSNAYIVDNRVAPILSLSYGLCEGFLSPAQNAFYNALFQQAAAEGITVFSSSGDNGAAGCDAVAGYSPGELGRAVNGLASTPYNVAVGGTQFDEGANPTAFWAPTYTADFSSALGYVPEKVWNETCDPSTDPDSCDQTGAYFLFAGSGGASSLYPKPAWQVGIGVPADGLRDLPDLSMTAAGGHDGYFVCVEGSCQTHEENGVPILDSATVVGGTSASTPAMAGVMALVEQVHGKYLGLANDDFYHLAARDQLSKCNASTLIDPTAPNSCFFHDITAGNNSVPGVDGFDAGVGYDLATGLGSVDAKNLVDGWGYFIQRATTTSLFSPTQTITHGQPLPLTVTVKPANGSGMPSGDFSLLTSDHGAAAGGTLSNGNFVDTVTSLPGGQYTFSAHYGGDSLFTGSDSPAIPLTVLPEDSTASISGLVVNFNNKVVPYFGQVVYGQDMALQFDVAGLSGVGRPTGTIQVDLDGQPLLSSTSSGGGVWTQIDTLPADTGLLPGDHVVSATYGGDESFNAAAPTTFAIKVVPATPHTALDSAGVFTLVESQPLVLTIFASGGGILQPTGTVQLRDWYTDQPIGSPITLDANSQATVTLTFPALGDYELRADYSGDGNYNSLSANNEHGNEFGVPISVVSDAMFHDGFESP